MRELEPIRAARAELRMTRRLDVARIEHGKQRYREHCAKVERERRAYYKKQERKRREAEAARSIQILWRNKSHLGREDGTLSVHDAMGEERRRLAANRIVKRLRRWAERRRSANDEMLQEEMDKASVKIQSFSRCRAAQRVRSHKESMALLKANEVFFERMKRDARFIAAIRIQSCARRFVP